MNRTEHKIIFGDSRSMDIIDDKSIHLIITSPPYWQLKDYGVKGQIGFDDSYEDYINNLNMVWMECGRILHDGCRLCINIGDQFARAVYYGRYKVIPIRTEIIRFCETIGFDYMGAIIWQKVTTCNTTGGAVIMGSYPYPRNGIVKLDYEFILIFKKHGNPPKVSREIKEQSKLSKENWNEYFYGHWNFSGEKQDKHLAMFPAELPRRLIKMFSFKGETVLDPFLGSGTTTAAALELERNSIGYEINRGFGETIRGKVESHQNSMFSKVDINYADSETSEEEINEIRKRLPYRFVDPLIINKKIDPSKLNFGSRINGNEIKSSNYSVKEIISPEMVSLQTGLKLKLIGIKTKKGKITEARKYLNDKVKGKQVILKYDADKYDKNGNLLCYLYLKNKTFVNKHLIKNGLAVADRASSYRYRNDFISLERNGNKNNL